MVALFSLVISPVDGEAAYGNDWVNEDEAYAFLWESYLAAQRCDDRWEEQHMDPSATVTTATSGEPTYTMNRDEWLRRYREQCRFYMRQPFSRHGHSVSVSPYGTTVRWAGKTEEANVPTFIWAPGKPGSGEVVMTLVKDGGIVKIRDIQRAFTFDKQEGDSR